MCLACPHAHGVPHATARSHTTQSCQSHKRVWTVTNHQLHPYQVRWQLHSIWYQVCWQLCSIWYGIRCAGSCAAKHAPMLTHDYAPAPWQTQDNLSATPAMQLLVGYAIHGNVVHARLHVTLHVIHAGQGGGGLAAPYRRLLRCGWAPPLLLLKRFLAWCRVRLRNAMFVDSVQNMSMSWC